MLQLNELNLKHYVLFKELNFQFQNGVTLVGGHNRNGKSLIIKAMEVLLYGKENNRKLPATSTVELLYSKVMEKKSIDYRLVAKTSKATKYNFFRNEKDMQPHKITDALRLMRNSNPIPYPLYASTVSLQGVKGHALLDGSPSTKAEWLSGVLDLVTVYEGYAEQVSTKLSSLLKEQTKLHVIKSEYESIKAEMPINHSGLTGSTYQEAIENLETNQEELKKISERMIFLENALILLKNMPPRFLDMDEKSVQNKSKSLLTEEAELKHDIKLAKAYEREIAEYKDLMKELSSIESRLKVNKVTNKSIKKLESELDELEKQAKNFEDTMSDYEKQSGLRKFLKGISVVEIPDISAEKQLRKVERLKAKCQMVKDRGITLRDKSSLGSKCPTCGNDMDQKHLDKELSETRDEYNRLTSSITKEDHLHKILIAKNTKLIKKPVKPNEKRMKELLLLIKDYHRSVELKADIPTVTKPKVKLSSLNKRLEDVQGKLADQHFLEIERHEVSVFLKMSPKWLIKVYKERTQKKVIKSYDAEINELRTQRRKITNIVNELSSTTKQYEHYKTASSGSSSSLKRMKEQIAELSEGTKDIEPLKALQQAFGNSGLRLSQLREAAANLSKKMTELSPLFFGDQYRFEMIVEPRKLMLNVHCNGIQSTLEDLSGSETRMFKLLFAMSLLHILPHRLRCDTMILDELEATLDEPSRQRYVKDILPELNNLVPKIIVVTPLIHGELNLSHDRAYRVEKKFKNGEYFSKLSLM